MTPSELRIQYCREQTEKIVLTEEEEKNALWEGKVKKYFREKHREYWIEKESEKPGKTVG